MVTPDSDSSSLISPFLPILKKRFLIPALVLMTLGVIVYFIERDFKSKSPRVLPINAPADNLSARPIAVEYPAPIAKQQERPEGRFLIRLRDKHDGRPPYGYNLEIYAQRLQNLKLTSDQVEQLQDVYSSIYEARLDYEISKARVSAINLNQTLIEIPSYPFIGDELKQEETSLIQSILGRDLANTVLAQIGGAIDSSNQSWGRFSQTLLVSTDVQTGACRITHSLYVDPSSGSNAGAVAVEKDYNYPADDLGLYRKFAPLLPKRARR